MFNIEQYLSKRLKKSTFGHFLVREGMACAYNALKIETIYFNAELLPFIQETTQHNIGDVLAVIPETHVERFKVVLDKICNAHVLVPLEYNEIDYLKNVWELAFSGPSIRVLVLHLTDYCNLRCKYCFIEGNIPSGYERTNMTEDVIARSIDKFGEIIKGKKFSKSPSIVFYGGEPLCNWKTILFGLEYLKESQEKGVLPEAIQKVMISNGTLITREIADALKLHKVMVSLSMDGPKFIHDLNRVFRDGKGSFFSAMKGFEILKESGNHPTVSCVLSRESLDHTNTIIRWLLDGLQIKALGFNHVSIVPNINFYDPDYEKRFSKALLDVQDVIQAEYPQVYERRMNHKFNMFLDRNILKADCTGCGEQMSVSPLGEIGICQGYMGSRKTFGGSVFDRLYDPTKDETFIEWSNRSPLKMSQCYNCIALSTCGGGCPRNADFINGSIWEVDSAFCHFARQAQEWMIWKKYQE